MFTNNEEFNPCDMYRIDMPQEVKDKQREKAVKQAVNFLVAQGIIKYSNILLQ